jgi:hypothetical protein
LNREVERIKNDSFEYFSKSPACVSTPGFFVMGQVAQLIKQAPQ